jgi:hypothetical protein
MLAPGKTTEIAREMRRYKIEILPIQENKMARKGKDRQNELHTILRWGEEAREERNSIF